MQDGGLTARYVNRSDHGGRRRSKYATFSKTNEDLQREEEEKKQAEANEMVESMQVMGLGKDDNDDKMDMMVEKSEYSKIISRRRKKKKYPLKASHR